jgi:hypothetical protein
MTTPASPRTRFVFLPILLLVGIVALRGPGFLSPREDKAEELEATLQSLDAARAAAQAYWDSTGAPPATLTVVGLGALPFIYRATEDQFLVAARSPYGDTVGYQSPTRPRDALPIPR